MMDRLRDDIRAVHSRRQAALGDLAGSSERVMRSALQRRDEPIGRRTQFAAGIAAVVMAVLVVATFAYVRAGSRPHTVVPPVIVSSPSPSPTNGKAPPPVASPVPTSPDPFPGLVRIDTDLVDSLTAWTLLSNCSTAGPCQYSVSATIDNGEKWASPVQVGPSYDPTNGDAPRTIRFINSRDGFVYGGGGAFVTHDAGKTWSSLDLHATFFNVIAGRGQNVWAFTYPCAKGVSCSYAAFFSRDGGRSWSVPRSLPVGFSPFQAVVFGTSGGFVSSLPGDMQITADGGQTWRSITDQCRNNPFRISIATADGLDLWELCTGYSRPDSPDSADKQLYESEDGGYTWAQKGTSQGGGKLPALGTQVTIVSTQPYELLLGTDKTPILQTTDAASTWTQVPSSPAGGVAWIRFVSAQMGWAMDTSQGAIWSTTDGGASWTRLG